MKEIQESAPKNRQLDHRLLAIGYLLLFGGFSLSAQNLFDIPAYELSAEQIRKSAELWKLTPQKVKTVLELNVESHYGRSSSPERKQQQKEELQVLREKYLEQYFYIDQNPAAHVKYSPLVGQ